MKLLWQPTPAFIAESNLTQFLHWLQSEKGLNFDNYDALWQWSVTNIASFWESIVQFYELDIKYNAVLSGAMPNSRWFEGATLNYAEYIFRQSNDKHPAILYQTENSHLKAISWQELRHEVTSLSHYLRNLGIKKGDCIVGYLPNSPQAIVAFLATVSIGAIWSSASPDFGTNAVIERFEQIQPKVLFAVNSYQYGGKVFDKKTDVEAISRAIQSIEKTIVVELGIENWELSISKNQFSANLEFQIPNLIFEQVPFSHPIWVVYSSGTTGMPKAITHSQGGVLLEYLKSHGLHNNIKKGDRFFWYSNTGWIMWNIAQGALLAGATLVLYDGNPAYPNPECLWTFVETAQITHFGTGAAYILACMKADIKPQKFNLNSLKVIGSTGSPLPMEGFEWIYENVSKTAFLASLSGGTDVAAGFVGGCPHLPVYAGEIQCRMLGAAVEAWDENGHALINEVGELVITQPMPNMPIYFWNDADGSKYQSSYFDIYPNIWRHGDWLSITPTGGVIISGRSDATLNKNGIRIGTSEVYRVVEQVDAVQDSLILNIEYPDGTSWMPLFVQMKNDRKLNKSIEESIKNNLKKQCSPRYVPDVVIEVLEIPYTMSGKKLEVPIKKIFMGISPQKAVNLGAMRNPDSIAQFIEIYQKQI